MDDERDSFRIVFRKSELVTLVPPDYLRELFNRSGYWEQVQTGEYSVALRRDVPIDTRGTNFPPGSRSQIVAYFDQQGVRVAVVHQIMLPDGSLGAGGLPDPKYLRIDGNAYACEDGGKPVSWPGRRN